MPLPAYISTAAQTRYTPGRHDCITFISRWADHVSGSQFVEAFGGTYLTKWHGIARHAPRGINAAIAEVLTAAGWSQIPPDSLADGDIVLTDLEHPGLWHGGKIHCQPVGCMGALQLDPRHAKGGFRWVA